MCKIALYIILILYLGGFVELFTKGTMSLFVIDIIFISPFVLYFLVVCFWIIWKEIIQPGFID